MHRATHCLTPNGSGPGASADSNFWGATYDFTFKRWGTVGGYVLIGQDLGFDGPVGLPDSKLQTYGVRWNRGMMTDDKLNMFDWNLEYAMQSGDIGDPFVTTPDDRYFELRSSRRGSRSTSTWATHTVAFTSERSSPPVRTRRRSTSSPSSRCTAISTRTTASATWIGSIDSDRSNITDYNVGYEHWFGDAHYVMFAYHMFADTESAVGQTEDKIGDEIDLKYGYKYSKNLGFEVTVGQASPDEAYWVSSAWGPTTDPVERMTFMAKVNW